jgi:hypothetical protein
MGTDLSCGDGMVRLIFVERDFYNARGYASVNVGSVDAWSIPFQ